MKQYDLVDYTLAGGFIIVLGTMCYLVTTGQAVPEPLSTIFWALAVGLGLKKTPDIIGK
jgi:hypothetical protein